VGEWAGEGESAGMLGSFLFLFLFRKALLAGGCGLLFLLFSFCLVFFSFFFLTRLWAVYSGALVLLSVVWAWV
jgi:hypothetical protein